MRTAVEVLGTAGGFTGLARRASRDKVAILAYHNVVEPEYAGRADSSLHLPLPRFLAQIERVARTHSIVPLDDVLSDHADPDRPSERPRAVITFDDAYRGAVTLALPELRRRGIPATVFVSPGLLGKDSTWWDLMGEAGALTPDAREYALRSHGGRHQVLWDRLFSRGQIRPLPRSFGIATEEELLSHCGRDIVLGSHTWGHEYLPALEDDELRDNLSRTLQWLGDFPGATSPWLALPYGAGTLRQSRLALGLGHRGVLRVRGGLWSPPGDAAAVPRINVPAGASVRGLELRTSGIRKA